MIRLLIALLLATPAFAADHLKTGTISTNGNDCTTATACVVLSTVSTSKGTIAVRGTWTGADFRFEATTDNTIWSPLAATPSSGGSAATGVTTTTIGSGLTWTWTGGYSQVRVRAGALQSGTAIVTIIATSG